MAKKLREEPCNFTPNLIEIDAALCTGWATSNVGCYYHGNSFKKCYLVGKILESDVESSLLKNVLLILFCCRETIWKQKQYRKEVSKSYLLFEIFNWEGNIFEKLLRNGSRLWRFNHAKNKRHSNKEESNQDSLQSIWLLDLKIWQ